jgi:N-acetylneuraminic acid mutarotase
MLTGREQHVAVVIDNKLFCLGGTIKARTTPDELMVKGIKSVEYFTFTTNKWQKGPDLPYTLLSVYDAQAIFDGVSKQCVITGGVRDGEISSKVSVFHPQKGMQDIQEVLDIGRGQHVAVLM